MKTIGTGLENPDGVAVDSQGDIYIADENGLVEITPTGFQAMIGLDLNVPVGVAVDVNAPVSSGSADNGPVRSS